jgi:hypothetical protein
MVDITMNMAVLGRAGFMIANVGKSAHALAGRKALFQ